MKSVKEIDRNKIKTEYVTTDISFRKLAEKYGISKTTVCKAAKEEDWAELRREYREKTCRSAVEKVSSEESERLYKAIAATNKAAEVALNALEDEKQFNRYIVTEALGGGMTSTEEKIFDKIDTKALKEITGVIKDLTGLMRDFYNIPTPAQAEAQRVAAQRLELDRLKAESDNENDKDIRIIIDGEAKEWAE